MVLTHVISKSINSESVTLQLYGEIGTKIDGDYFASEIIYLSGIYDEIIIRINSGGGSVIQGLSIFSAILSSTAKTKAIIDGLAASMAGVIAMAADSIEMNDFARLMVHNPYNPDNSNPNPKEKKALDNIKSMLNQILSRRGMEQEKMDDFMNKETWFTATQAKELNLIDTIISTGKEVAVNSFISGIAANILNENHFTNFIINQKPKEMKIIASLFGLGENAMESEIVAKIQAITAEKNELQNSLTALNTELNALKLDKNNAQKAEVLNLVENAIKAGFFASDLKAELIANGETNFNAFKSMICALKAPTASLSDVLKAASPVIDENTKTFEYYLDHVEEGLKLQKEKPEMYNALETAYVKKNS